MGPAVPPRVVLIDLASIPDLDPVVDALAAAYRQSRDRIEAVAYMERHDLLDGVERVGRALDQHLEEAGKELVETDQAVLFSEAYAAVGFDIPQDVIAHVRMQQVGALFRGARVVSAVAALLSSASWVGVVANIAGSRRVVPLSRTAPSPEPFAADPGAWNGMFGATLDRLGLAPADALFVGSRPEDLQCAASLGMRTAQDLPAAT